MCKIAQKRQVATGSGGMLPVGEIPGLARAVRLLSTSWDVMDEDLERLAAGDE